MMKKRILILAHYMHIGGAEIGLLGALDTERIRSLKLLRIQAKHIQNAAAARSRMYRVTTSLMNKRAYGLLDLLLWVRLYNMHKGKCGG